MTRRVTLVGRRCYEAILVSEIGSPVDTAWKSCCGSIPPCFRGWVRYEINRFAPVLPASDVEAGRDVEQRLAEALLQIGKKTLIMMPSRSGGMVDAPVSKTEKQGLWGAVGYSQARIYI